MTPFALASGPSTTCSLSITASNPASSATRAHRTSSARSRPEVNVQFSLRIISIRGTIATGSADEELDQHDRDDCEAAEPEEEVQHGVLAGHGEQHDDNSGDHRGHHRAEEGSTRPVDAVQARRQDTGATHREEVTGSGVLEREQ